MRLILLAAAMFTIGGCATKHYGRLQPLSGAERAGLTCREIAIELSRVEAFEDNIRRQSHINGRSALAFVNDLGIGNAMERGDAERSAAERRQQLREIEAERGCAAPSPAQP